MKTKTLTRPDLKPTAIVILLAALALLLAACTSAVQAPQTTSTSPAAVSTPAATQPPSSAGEATINVATDPELGKILVDGKGMTLYMFTKDEADKSNCNADCLASWPPLLTEGNPTLGAGVDASLVGSAPLADGSLIVTYNHMPLYYWVKDTKAGDTTGQGVGGVWYVVSPDGKPVGAPGSASANTGPQAAAEATINVATHPNLGQILVDGRGMTLYIFKNDERDKSNCDADCLAKWPPLLTQGSPTLGAGVDASQVGTAELADGSMIVTSDHKPLYYWINDVEAGDTTGQGVGDVWYVISPTGEEIDDPEDVIGAALPGSTFTEPTINVYNDPILGPILVDGKGMTLYMYTRDTADTVNCEGDCLVSWPPLVTKGSPILGPGVDDSLVGTATLPDGSLIVTYNHMPLYYWIKDTQAGDTTGQGVGGVWYVVSPEGEVIGR